MKKNFIYIPLLFSLLTSCGTVQQGVNTPLVNQKTNDAKGTEMLLGHCSRYCLHQLPYKEWFEKNYTDYVVDSVFADKLKDLLTGKTIVVFMGTWCGDSRREVPRLIKILDYCNVPDERLKLIMLDYQDGVYKQSPQHEEKGKQIFRVPSIIVMSGNREVGRIVESPRKSMEKDLLDILTGQKYQPNYAAGKWFLQKMDRTSLKKLYKDSSAIIQKIRPGLKNSAELSSIGYVLMDRNEKDKAIFTFLVNTGLYPLSMSTYNGLASAYIQNGEKEKAKLVLEKAKQVEPNNEETKRLFKLL
jgi:tetratricopeptide (TPR) repeat protein